MVKREIIQKRVSKVNEYLDFLREIKQDYSLEEFKSNPMVYGSTERFLHLTIEALIDIGNHLIADQGLGRVEAYSDIPKILYQNNYLDQDLKDIFIKIVGFRNVLVHDYMEVDLDIVHSVVNDNLEDLVDILKEFACFL
ncbi:DUF86 domain-containing protein [Natroniella acetigena]|uniref:type VII toxin-antitoxin system HepT family RNase toxin n=1 Tax=Natroniella acetigena TaxID=52004 RepID=UPI00200AB073|nr:DUF86 domain-containing protein [Natroniella acetigena]MCK8828005.1 DUF86 domain-containing protein [Natroniella acetigena]